MTITTIIDHGSAVTAGVMHREPLAAVFRRGDHIIAWSDTNLTTRPAGLKDNDPRVRRVNTGGAWGGHYGILASEILLDEI